MKNKNTSWVYIILASGSAAILTGSLAWAQFEYYDPYSNSSIDYFPMNPINTGASKSGGSGGISSTPSSQKKTTEIAPTSATVPPPVCANKPKPNPGNTRSVEIRDESGKVFYLSPPKEEVIGVRAYPETSKKILKINDGTETGLIEDDNGCYPKFGHIQNPLSAPSPSAQPANALPDTTVPFDRTAAVLDPATGKVYDADTKELINDARYDPAAKKIYYKDSNSIFGTVFTETSGYVNIDTSSIKNQIQKEKTAATKNKKIKKKSKTKKPVPAKKKSKEGLPGLCDSQSGCLSYCMNNRQACLHYCEKGDSKNPLCKQLTNTSENSMMQMMKKMQGGGFGGFGGAGTGAVFDPMKETLPKIAVANFIDLDWQVQRISKFRGGYGHDYSFGTGETCRSMKHYFWAKGGDPGQPHNPKWMTIALYAPADGVIERVQTSNNSDGPEAQFSILVDANKAFRFGFHHVRLESGLTDGSNVKAGQKLGTIGNENNHGEIAVEITTPQGRSLVSFFEVASDEVLKAYAARGLTDIQNVIYSKEERDAKPLVCDKNTVEGRFTGGSEGGTTDSAGMANWFELQ